MARLTSSDGAADEFGLGREGRGSTRREYILHQTQMPNSFWGGEEEREVLLFLLLLHHHHSPTKLNHLSEKKRRNKRTNERTHKETKRTPPSPAPEGGRRRETSKLLSSFFLWERRVAWRGEEYHTPKLIPLLLRKKMSCWMRHTETLNKFPAGRRREEEKKGLLQIPKPQASFGRSEEGGTTTPKSNLPPSPKKTNSKTF